MNNLILFSIIFLLVIYIFYINYSISKIIKIIKKLKKKDVYIKWPNFKSKSLNYIIDFLIDTRENLITREKELTLHLNLIKNILELLDEGVILIDKNGYVIHFNNWAKKNLNLSIEAKKHLLYTTNNAKLLDLFSNILENKENIYNTEYYNNDRVLTILCKTFDEYRLIIFLDVTERTMYGQYKYELTANLTHELKTPVSLIMNYAETLLINPDIDKNTQIKFLNSIYRGSERLNKLINDIVQLYKIESLEKNIEYIKVENLDIIDVINELKDYYAHTDREITFNNNVKYCKIGREHLLSILTNLIDNAIKYTDKEIRIDLDKKENTLIIAVSDRGPKIADKEKNRIFERFYTNSRTRNIENKGTGLGLSIVKHIAKLYSGKVYLKTNSKGGNTFVIELNV
ncbi:MAG: ATP-binding protein [Deferribacterota bacterium]|nr:ATP-binding protein [Deferribacterota bacterium]